MQNPSAYFSDRILELGLTFNELTKKASSIALARGVLALLIIASIYGSFALSGYFLWVIFLCGGIFLYLVKQSATLSKETAILKKIIDLNVDELALLGGDKSVFDTRSYPAGEGQLFASDLDIFGKGSLFQAIDRTSTREGGKRVMQSLLTPSVTEVDILNRMAAIRELAPLSEWRQRFYGVGSRVPVVEHNREEIRRWADAPQFYLNRRWWLWIAAVLSCILLSGIIWMIAIASFSPMIFLLVAINSLSFSYFARQANAYFLLLGNRTDYFQKFSELFSLVEERTFTSTSPRDIQQKASAAAKAFGELWLLSNAAGQRRGPMGPVMNRLFFFDLWNIRKIEKWRKEHGQDVNDWISSLAEMDMLNSFANFAFNHPSYSYATLLPGKSMIAAKQMGHPLIAENLAVRNDYAIGEDANAHIITGSNMAGKSTFIRSLGLNVLLAMNGMPVCAEQFSCSVLRIVCCIRITDSLEENASYFKAELLRLAQVIAALKETPPCLVLLDEILRGTNSNDKRHGTMAFYKKLAAYNCIALLATHDLVVGSLASDDPHHFANFCFESTVVEDELVFDYRLRSGISSSANASFLMQRMGLI